MNRLKSDRTADIRTIFKHDKGHVNPDTGATEDGYWCTLCQSAFFSLYYFALCLMSLVRDGGIRMHSCFFLGSVTSLHTHIAW